MVDLFEYDHDLGKIKPTVHCYTIRYLRNVMDKYRDGEAYLSVYQYLYYKHCPIRKNPFSNIREEERESKIIESIDINFDLDDPVVMAADEGCKELYSTPTTRAYKGLKSLIDNIGDYMATASISGSEKDGNLRALVTAAKDLRHIRASFDDTQYDLEVEQGYRARGSKKIAYDQRRRK